jgi:hypothetical protein
MGFFQIEPRTSGLFKIVYWLRQILGHSFGPGHLRRFQYVRADVRSYHEETYWPGSYHRTAMITVALDLSPRSEIYS